MRVFALSIFGDLTLAILHSLLLTAGITVAPQGLPCFFRHFCGVFQDAKPALKPYTLRRRGEALDWINELTMTLIQSSSCSSGWP